MMEKLTHLSYRVAALHRKITYLFGVQGFKHWLLIQACLGAHSLLLLHPISTNIIEFVFV